MSPRSAVYRLSKLHGLFVLINVSMHDSVITRLIPRTEAT